MTREARYNLIFLIALLVLSLPGMVILVSKALRGTGGLSSAPPGARVATPYLNPVGTSTGTVRLVPPATMAFVDDVARSHTGFPALRVDGAGGRPVPVMGDALHVEVLGHGGGSWLVAIWHHADGADVDAVEARADGVPVAADVVAHVNVPTHVRRELQKGPPMSGVVGFAGYAAPPRRLSVTRIEAASRTRRLDLSWSRGGSARSDSVDLTPLADAALPHAADADIPTRSDASQD